MLMFYAIFLYVPKYSFVGKHDRFDMIICVAFNMMCLPNVLTSLVKTEGNYTLLSFVFITFQRLHNFKHRIFTIMVHFIFCMNGSNFV